MNMKIASHTQQVLTRQWLVIGLSALMLFVAGCAEVEDDDGVKLSGVTLPTDSSLTLYCADAGVGAEPCVLDDPDNPYALTPITDANKFELSIAAPSAKARYYLWATAQAMSPRGENQFYTAAALHEMYSESNSELARTQALRGYRAVLDLYFNSVTFFEADWLADDFDPDDDDSDLFFPFPVRKLVGTNMHSPGAPYASLFDDPAQALELFGEWGFTYDDAGTRDFSRNY